MDNLRIFETVADYSAATINDPSVSWVKEDDSVHYDPYVPPKIRFKYMSLSPAEIKCNSSTTLTRSESRRFYDDMIEAQIGDCVTSIGDEAFEDCINLSSVTIPSSVTTIGNYAFYDCIGLSSITIPDSVTSIGQGFLSGCHTLNSFTINATTPPTLGTNAFYDTNNYWTLYVPAASVNAYKTASGWSTYASRIQPIP